MWISDPTPVTISSITVESWSTWKPTLTWRLPTGIQDQYWNTTGASVCRPTNERKTAIPIANAPSSTPTPMIDTAVFSAGRASASAPFSTKPRRANAGASQMRSTAVPVTSVPEQIHVLQADRLLVAIDGENDREAHGGLGGGHRHHEEHEYLPADPQRLRERDERQIDGVEHQLDAHEDHDRIAAQQDAGDAEREQHRGDRERRAEQHLQLPFREHDRAHDRGEQQHARDLERHEIRVEQRACDGADDPLARLYGGEGAGWQLDGAGRERLCPTEHAQLEEQRSRQDRRQQEADGSLDVGGAGTPEVQQHDHEQEQHHDRARVDEHLQRRDELGVEHHVHRGQGEQCDHEPERAHHRIPARDAQQGAPHRNDAEDPEDGESHYSPFGSDGSHSVDTG